MKRYVSVAIVLCSAACVVAVVVRWLDAPQFLVCAAGMLLVDVIDRRLPA